MSKEKKKENQAELAPFRGVVNADYASALYKKIPCKIGYRYARFQVEGTVLPCCVVPKAMGSLHETEWKDIWLSREYFAFRDKLARIHDERFHLVDPHWSFCKQCPHTEINLQFQKSLDAWERMKKRAKPRSKAKKK